MKTYNASLRLRLLVLIMLPLLVASTIAVAWRYNTAKQTTEEIFDRTLSALTLAVFRDIVISDGDSLSPATSDMMRQTIGGEVFYHVNGPDGSFITGYAYPPQRPKDVLIVENRPTLFSSSIRNTPVRAAQLYEEVSIDGVKGKSTITIWQTNKTRNAFTKALATQAALITAFLSITVAGLVWFGISLGLKPLTDLEGAIAKRSPNDLRKIQRAIPDEAVGIVTTLNNLFDQLSESLEIKDRFISNAAHQLRNPIASIHSMAQAVMDVKTFSESKKRAGELVEATRYASRLTKQLLSYERLKDTNTEVEFRKIELNTLVEKVCRKNAARALSEEIDFIFEASKCEIYIDANDLLLSEAIENLIDNAVMHGGNELTNICVSVGIQKNNAIISVCNDGEEIPKNMSVKIFERFAQITGKTGTGLGLSIVSEITKIHSGEVSLTSTSNTCFKISLPKAPSVL
ncbi:sensor histidine kinase [Amylibacter sp. SFDW26]|uniref:sensor histidine kinase n=1 Tax=Amylibacter sp. SFDW26 TaxID=2652722 RepID=UPI0012623888|nr:sensor histidine kinase [Amylibacter sp. SFDW26]KAB7610511.1 sensor histidine kinase [Amylibacter sp. SFDW26]